MVGIVACLCLAALCSTNINFVTRAFLGKDQVFSVLYLMASLVCLFTFQFKVGQALGKPGILWVFAMLFFLALATRMGMGISSAYYLSPSSNLYRLLVAQMITVSMALGMRHILLAGKMQVALRWLFAMTVVAALTVIVTKKAPWLLKFVGHLTQDRAAGFFGDPNRAGQAICVSAAIGFASLVNETSLKWKAMVYAGLLALVPCLFLTYSRSSIIFMVVLVGMQFFISPILKQKETSIAILLVALTIPVGVSYVLNQKASNADAWDQANKSAQKERMESFFRILSGNFDAADTGHRFVLAAAGLNRFASSPIIGIGYQKLVLMDEVGVGCHNTFLRVAGEAGIFAFLIYVGSLIVISIAGWRCGNPAVRCLVLGYVAMYACSCMVSHSILTNRLHNVMMGVCAGFLSATIVVRRQEARQRKLARQQRDRAMVGIPPTPVPQLQPAGAASPAPVGIPQPGSASV